MPVAYYNNIIMMLPKLLLYISSLPPYIGLLLHSHWLFLLLSEINTEYGYPETTSTDNIIVMYYCLRPRPALC